MSGKESGPSTTVQGIGEKLRGTFNFAVPIITVSVGSFVPVSRSTFFYGGSVDCGQDSRPGVGL